MMVVCCRPAKKAQSCGACLDARSESERVGCRQAEEGKEGRRGAVGAAAGRKAAHGLTWWTWCETRRKCVAESGCVMCVAAVLHCEHFREAAYARFLSSVNIWDNVWKPRGRRRRSQSSVGAASVEGDRYKGCHRDFKAGRREQQGVASVRACRGRTPSKAAILQTRVFPGKRVLAARVFDPRLAGPNSDVRALGVHI